MPGRLKTQRRGRGTPKYTASNKGIRCTYVNYTDEQKTDVLLGEVVDLKKTTARNSIVAIERFLIDGRETDTQVIAAEGLSIGQRIQYGNNAEIAIGNVLPLTKIPEGCPVFNIEKEMGDGGTFVKEGGVYAILVTKDKKNAYIKLPSGKTKPFKLGVRATIGCSACGGRTEKPFIKAGTKFFAMKRKKKMWPIVRGVAMNAAYHPHGGEQHHVGKSKSVSRHASPGRKVGAIASKRTGRKKKN